MTLASDAGRVGVVVIGRNEEGHLGKCLTSVTDDVAAIIYVDSGSSDSSLDIARAHGTIVVELCATKAFSAARARNAGLARLLETLPGVEFVQFVDGDCVLSEGWLEKAMKELAGNDEIGVVCGRRREVRSEASVYNRLCDLEWDTPIGESDSCGGDALMRCEALALAGGYNESLIAGEEPELCIRLRRLGYRILRIDAEMTKHDAAIERFSQWWTRTVRAGHAFTEVSRMHPEPPWQIWRHDTRSIWLWSFWIPLTIACAATFDVRALFLLGLFPAQAIRIFLKSRGRGWSLADSALFSGMCLVAKYPQALGALRFYRSQWRREATPLMEYRRNTASSNAKERRPRVAELINQYPQASHTFVRREIHGLEDAGFDVLRVSIRETKERLVDPEDRAELQKTRALLGCSKATLLGAILRTSLRHPLATVRTSLSCLRHWSQSERSLIVHGAYLAEACLLLNWSRSERVEWIHAHFGTNAATVAMLCRDLGGPPFSFTVHGPEEFDHPLALGIPEKIRNAAFTVAISNYGRSQLMRWSDQHDWPRIHVVRCGIDTSSEASCMKPVPDTDQLVCVARLAEQKGLFVLLDALSHLAVDGVACHVRIIGDGPLRSSIEKRAAELGIGSMLTLLGWQDGSTVLDELREARGFVLPSFAEGLPVVLMEALGAARPVVTTYVAGIPELVQNDDNGWLVPAGASRELARAMRELLEAQPARLTEMGIRGAKRVGQLHDSRISATRLGGLIQSNLDGRSPAPESLSEMNDLVGLE